MHWFYLHNLLLLILIVQFKYIQVISLRIDKSKDAHLRYKRFALFPEGSSFSATFASSFLIYPIFFEGFQFSTNYDLPMNESLLLTSTSSSGRATLMRKRRSELYNDLEFLMNSNSFNGQICVYRTLCEAAQKLISKNSLIDALLSVIFHFPHENITESEPQNHHSYKYARDNGIEGENCQKIYDRCPFSFLDFQFDKFV